MPAVGEASTAKIEDNVLVFVAAPGEANRLKLTYDRGYQARGRYLLRDAGGPIIAGIGCAALAAQEVSCSGDLFQVAIRVGDRDDRVVMPPTYAPVKPPPPPPDPRGGHYDSRFGALVNGGKGDDEVIGGRPVGETFTEEHLKGGPGEDRLIARGGGGPFGSLDGGGGDDRLGCAQSSWGCNLRGGDGADLLSARGRAAFELMGGPGADRIRSMNGNIGFEGEGEDVDCGAGSDLYWSDAGDSIRSCESAGEFDDFSAFKGLSVCGPSRPMQACSLFRPRLSASSRGRRRGTRIVTRSTGRLTHTLGEPCSGRVHLRVRAGHRALIRARARVSRSCRWTKRYALPTGRLPQNRRRRLARDQPISLRASFEYRGGTVLFSARTLTKRYTARP